MEEEKKKKKEGEKKECHQHQHLHYHPTTASPSGHRRRHRGARVNLLFEKKEKVGLSFGSNKKISDNKTESLSKNV
jgi:hypothetical protein